MWIVKRRWFAYIVLALTVILTIALSGGRALRIERDDVTRVFSLGPDGSGLSIANDLKARSLAAISLSDVAERNGVDGALVNQVREKARALEEAISVKDASTFNNELEEGVSVLVNGIDDSALSEADRSLLRNNQAEFASRGRVILNDQTYNEMAEAFNKRLAAFPANFIARIAGIRPLERF